MEEYKNFRWHGKKGVDDLMSLSPYSEGDWPVYIGRYGITEEEYKKDVDGYRNRVIQENDAYIKKLKADGQYLAEYHVDFMFADLPEFNSPPIDYSNFGIAVPLGNVKDDKETPKFGIEYGKGT